MKKGKTAQLKLFNNAKCHYGTVDAKNLKSIYIVLQTWVSPKKDYEKWDRVTSSIKRDIKFTLNEICDNDLFESYYIVDLDLRSSGIQIGKRSFMNLEITLFLKKPIEFKSNELKKEVKNIISSIYNDNILNTRFFNIHKTKTTKELV